MGQRLNVQIIKNDKVVANSYFHWSAYTYSASTLVEKMIDKYYELKEELINNDLLFAIRMLEASGAKLKEEEHNFIDANNLFNGEEFENAQNRNDGLIAITEGGMQNIRDWEEGRVDIDLDDENVMFDVISCFSKEDYEEYLKDCENEDEDLEYDNLPTVDVDSDFNISFSEFSSVFDKIFNSNADVFKTPNGEVVETI